MTRGRQWLLGLGAFAAVLALAGLIAISLVPRDDELARRAGAALSKATGTPVSVGALQWQLLPSPAVVLHNVATTQPQPVTLARLTLYPEVSALLQRRIKINRAVLDGASLPQRSLRDLGRAAQAQTAAPQRFKPDDLPLARVEFRDVTWVSRLGVAVIYNGEADFDAGWRPRSARLSRPGVQPATDLVLTRNGQQDRWDTRLNVGGGTANGEVNIQTGADGRLQLSGQLQPDNIDAAGAMTAFNRRPVLAGKASGTTLLSADGDSLPALAQTFQTRSSLRFSRARLLRFDLEKAVRSAGREFAGQTPLDSLTAQLDTQNTPQGIVVSFRNVKASSGALTATGQARLLNRQIEGEFAVDLVEGLVGVPLKVSGPVADVKVSVPAGAVAGAAVGTAVLPGVGTAIGARIGATLGKIFGADADARTGQKRDKAPGKAAVPARPRASGGSR